MAATSDDRGTVDPAGQPSPVSPAASSGVGRSSSGSLSGALSLFKAVPGSILASVLGFITVWLSPSYTSLRVRAGEQAPDIVLFGALRASAQPQFAVADSDASASLECAGPSAAGET